MRKIIQYTVVGGSSDWEERINEMIGDGWQPHGNLNVVLNNVGDRSFYQAMVVYEEEGKVHARS